MPLSRGQRLLRLRQQHGVDQRDVAAAIGVSRPYISHLERDEKGRNLDHIRATLERAAAYYGVNPAYLLADTPQEYIMAWVTQDGASVPSSFGERLKVVLLELQLRWGNEYDANWLAVGLGSTIGVLEEYMSGAMAVTVSVAEQISDLIGAPAAWLLGRSEQDAKPTADPGFARVLAKAATNGMSPSDLDMLVDAWLLGHGKKPSE